MQILTTKNGSTLGFLRDISPHQKQVFNRQGALLGYYNPKLDRTFERSGRLLGRGDLRAFLLSKNQ